MKIAVAQLNSNDDIEFNYQQIHTLVTQAGSRPEREKPKIIFFPENSLYFRIDSSESMPRIEITSEQIKKLELLSEQTGIYIHFTSSLYFRDKNWNASVLISPDGQSQVVYQKIHLFDIKLNEERAIRESDVFAHGENVTTFEIDGITFGSSICYDVRFAELYSELARKNVDVILVPAAFLVKTGRAHWEVLLRARAIENQCYVVAPAQAGIHRSHNKESQRETYGHTMVVDPWGSVMASLASGVGIIYAEINTDFRKDVQKQIPMFEHRRL